MVHNDETILRRVIQRENIRSIRIARYVGFLFGVLVGIGLAIGAFYGFFYFQGISVRLFTQPQEGSWNRQGETTSSRVRQDGIERERFGFCWSGPYQRMGRGIHQYEIQTSASIRDRSN